MRPAVHVLVQASCVLTCLREAAACDIRAAAAVFTGRVDALVTDEAAVNVKRVLRGGGAGLHAGSTVLVRLPAVVDGRERLQRCEAAVPSLRVHDTRLFLAQPTGNGTLRLVDMPLVLTRNLLRHASATLSDIVYKPRPPIIEEPCEKTYCQYGADCVTRADGSALCECPADCPVAATPVCGSDGLTYSNHCLLRLHACRSAKNIRVQYGGECGTRPRQKGHTAVNY